MGTVDFDQFVKNDQMYDAVIRNLEIIGEAARNMPDEIKRQYSQVEWRSIGALRNLLAHEYFGVKDEIIWDIIEHKIPVLLDQVDLILSELK